MRIAQIAPLFESVPPKLYGGTERVVSYLTEELVRLGHEVTLFASGDSQTSARLVLASERSLRLDPGCVDQLAHQIRQLERVFKDPEEFDVMHFHIDYVHYPLSRRYRLARLTTLHGRLDIPDLAAVYREFPHEPVVSISDGQRLPLPWLAWLGTVYHGLPVDLYPYQPKPGSYLAFIGRFSREKGPEEAIHIAREAGIPLKMAAKLDKADKEYFESRVRPLIESTSLVEWIGEIDERGKRDFLGGALALLFPIDWPEPFGLVMIEAMACGTPVIAYPCGSVPEIMTDGVTGFMVEGRQAAVQAVKKIAQLDRARVRETFEQRFTAPRMARDYIALYERQWQARRAAGPAERRRASLVARMASSPPIGGLVRPVRERRAPGVDRRQAAVERREAAVESAEPALEGATER
jgi:glycosyltransferase involved in cell wall biosynthesis